MSLKFVAAVQVVVFLAIALGLFFADVPKIKKAGEPCITPVKLTPI